LAADQSLAGKFAKNEAETTETADQNSRPLPAFPCIIKMTSTRKLDFTVALAPKMEKKHTTYALYILPHTFAPWEFFTLLKLHNVAFCIQEHSHGIFLLAIFYDLPFDIC